VKEDLRSNLHVNVRIEDQRRMTGAEHLKRTGAGIMSVGMH
jgi:hypothetical protein